MYQDNFNLSDYKPIGGSVSRVPILGLVFLLCLGAGLISAQMFKENNNPADAASANITVTDNNQAVSIDQATGGQIIQRTSTVTVRNPSAAYGYTLSAKIKDNNLPGSTINIFSSASTLCTQTAPCLLSASAFTDILTISSSNATNASGDTSLWNVIISVPANAGTGNYIIDIEYDERATPPPHYGMVDPSYNIN